MFHQEAFEPWWSYAREHYLDLDGDELPTATTFYYDPVVDVHHRLPASAALTTSFYAAPQVPADARRLFEAGCAAAGYHTDLAAPLRPGRAPASSLLLAREWGMDTLAGRLSTAIEASFEPTWDRSTGEFTWGMGLDEQHPRGAPAERLESQRAGAREKVQHPRALQRRIVAVLEDVEQALAHLVRGRAQMRGGIALAQPGQRLALEPPADDAHRPNASPAS